MNSYGTCTDTKYIYKHENPHSIPEKQMLAILYLRSFIYLIQNDTHTKRQR